MLQSGKAAGQSTAQSRAAGREHIKPLSQNPEQTLGQKHPELESWLQEWGPRSFLLYWDKQCPAEFHAKLKIGYGNWERAFISGKGRTADLNVGPGNRIAVTTAVEWLWPQATAVLIPSVSSSRAGWGSSRCFSSFPTLQLQPFKHEQSGSMHREKRKAVLDSICILSTHLK